MAKNFGHLAMDNPDNPDNQNNPTSKNLKTNLTAGCSTRMEVGHKTSQEPLELNHEPSVYSVSQKEVDENEEAELRKIIAHHSLFKNFDDNMLKLILENLNGFEVEAGTYIFKEGDEGNCFFIIKKGEIEETVKGEIKKILTKGHCFGESALMQKSLRNSTLKSLTDSELYVLEGEIYKSINININHSTKISEIVVLLELIPWIKTLEHSIKISLARRTSFIFYSEGSKFSSNEEDYYLYIIKEGKLTLLSFLNDSYEMGSQDYFSANWVFEGGNYKYENQDFECVFQEDTSMLRISKSSVEEALGANYRESILKSYLKDKIMKSKFFCNFFHESNFDELYDVFKFQYYSSEDVVYPSNTNLNKKFIIILEGSLVDVLINKFSQGDMQWHVEMTFSVKSLSTIMKSK
jgi:hypothetical protein